MLRFILRRLFMIAISFVAVVSITFYLLHAAPGNFVELSQLAAQQVYGPRTASGVQAEDPTVMMWEKRYGKNTPIWKQIIIFLRYAVTLDLGSSFRYPTDTIESLIAKTIPKTFLLVICSMALALAIGVPLGIVAALRRNTLVDRLMMLISMVGSAIPSYVLAVLFLLLFAVHWKVLPTSGWGQPKQMILPVLSLALGPIAGFARFMRSSLIGVLREDYIRTGYAKGGSTRQIILHHALRNSLIPLVTVAGPHFAFLMVGSVWIESMFNIPGLGSLFATAAPTRDYPLVIASSAFFALLIMVINLLVDLGYTLLDPRIRAGYVGRQ